MIYETKLYTWVDVQDLLANFFEQRSQRNWIKNVNFRCYWDGLSILYFESKDDIYPKTIQSITEKLSEIFLARLEVTNDGSYIWLEGGRKFAIFWEKAEEKEDIEEVILKPSLGRPAFIGADKQEYIDRSVDKSPVFYAFHSFKGGVGRTLHAIALAIQLSEKSKVLLIDADFEAPGITWLIDTSPISFADFLAMVHGSSDREEIVQQTSTLLKETAYENNNLYILPAFRGLNQDNFPILEIKPEDIFKFESNPFFLTDIIESLANQLKVDYVIIDLRAGVSELSSGWLLDPRINKVFVTTLSSQALLGTGKMFDILNKFNVDNSIKKESPFLIISQVPQESIKTLESSWAEGGNPIEESLQMLKGKYTKSFIDIYNLIKMEYYKDLTESEIEGRLLSSITFFSVENVNLKSLPPAWGDVSKLIRLNNLHRDLSSIINITPNNSFIEDQSKEEDFNQSRDKLSQVALNLIYAEENAKISYTTDTKFLVTASIRNIVNTFKMDVPIAVIVGAKGSGKTFLYHQIIGEPSWQDFRKQATNDSSSMAETPITIQPITIPNNPKKINNKIMKIWLEFIKPDIEKSLSSNLTKTQWRQKWLDYIAWANDYKVEEQNVGNGFIANLVKNSNRILTVFDGLEELFNNFDTSEQEQRAIESLLVDVPNWLDSQPIKVLGCIVFIRKDLISAAIPQNTGQFLQRYSHYELKWDSEEALRLVHWVLNNYKIFNNPTFSDWKITLNEKQFDELKEPLYKLWGKRMGADNSKEVFSYNAVLGLLANLKKEIQSRDIMRFLYFAAIKSMTEKGSTANSDRLLYPAAIKKAIDEVGAEKIREIKVENKPLGRILDVLDENKAEIKFPCKSEELIKIIPNERDIQILIDNGIIHLYIGEYYMAEIYRKGMGFDYSRKGKPKMLYL